MNRKRQFCLYYSMIAVLFITLLLIVIMIAVILYDVAFGIEPLEKGIRLLFWYLFIVAGWFVAFAQFVEVPNPDAETHEGSLS